MKKLVVAVVALGIGGVLFTAWSSGPRRSFDAERLAERLEAYDVRILRDSWGVPHIFGATDADTAYGLGFAHAEDDFATIQDSLLAARGEMASVYGPKAAPADYLVGLLRLREQVAARYESELSAEVRAVCEAYADGVSHYATLHPDAVLPNVLPFTGQDVVLGFMQRVPFFLGFVQELLHLLDPEGAAATIAGELVALGPPSSGPALVAGSNAIAVASSRSADGAIRLAINSHQPWEGPVAWYEAHLVSDEGWDMVGGVFPGAPVILHGHNRQLGWAHTVNQPDLVDVYELDVDPDDPDRYRFDGEWLELERWTVPIHVKLWGPFGWTFEREALQSVHGPAVRTEAGTFALRYAGQSDLRQVEQWYRMNKATDFESWRAAMRMESLPMFNTIYADADDNIFYVYNALLPDRRPGHDWRSKLPGDTSETLWESYLSFDELPQVENPPSGFLQNANSTPYQSTDGPGNPSPSSYPPELGIETHMTNRALRLQELFSADEAITAEEFHAYKFDQRYSPDSEVAAWIASLLADPPTGDPVLEEAIEVLSGWDLGTEIDNTGTAIGVLTVQPLILADLLKLPVPELRESFVEAAHTLREHYGRIDVPWSEVNRLVRGTVDVGLGGGPDILNAVYSAPPVDGRLTGRAGDCYVLMVEWKDGRVRSHSIHQYGSATLDESSPHYADQVPLFVNRELRPVWMDEEQIRAHLEREYVPGE